MLREGEKKLQLQGAYGHSVAALHKQKWATCLAHDKLKAIYQSADKIYKNRFKMNWK